MTGDLHCHTTYSDGSENPRELPDLARRFGLSCVAITDHDCVGGWDEAAQAADAGTLLLRGVEISTFNRKSGRKVHLLCYEPHKNKALLGLCQTIQKERERSAEKILAKVAERYPLDKDFVVRFKQKSPVIFKQHFTLALMHMGYSVSVFGPLYDSLFSKKTGWARFDPDYPETVDAMRVLKSTGGVCVLAHPGVYGNFGIIKELAAEGLDGIEVWHSRQTEEDTQKAAEAAEEFGLLKTGGSDFHGAYSSRPVPFGCRVTPDAALRVLLERLPHREFGGA